MQKNGNKKVLLRERKRHTARRVASTPYVFLTGYPPPPHPDLAGGGVPDLGTPPAGYPPQQGTPPGRIPPHQGTPPQYPPCQGTPCPPAGYPPSRVAPPTRVPPPVAAPWHSGKCCKALWDMGNPPPPVDRQMEGQTRVKTLPSRRTTYAGGKYLCVLRILLSLFFRDYLGGSSVPWVSFTVAGFQDSPVSWGQIEHGFHQNGDNLYNCVLFPDKHCWFYKLLGPNDRIS